MDISALLVSSRQWVFCLLLAKSFLGLLVTVLNSLRIVPHPSGRQAPSRDPLPHVLQVFL